MLLCLFLLIGPALGALSTAQNPPPAETQPEPKLVVLVVVDQLIPEQLDRLQPLLTGGLGRFWREGRTWPQARLPYARTETGPGHATLSTGCLPSTHGVVGNTFFNRATSKTAYCVGDGTTQAVLSSGEAREGSSVSPRRLRATTLAEALLAAHQGSQVLSISMKDRSAVCLAGPAPSIALWWDRTAGGFMSSTHYGDELPAFANTWNQTWRSQSEGYKWEWSWQQDLSQYGTALDDRLGETPFESCGVTFPYVLSRVDEGADDESRANQIKSIASSVLRFPLGDEFCIQLARAGLRTLGLGRGDGVDLLAVSLSGCDVLGHCAGPYSCEVTDIILRADRGLGQLLDDLDEQVGEGRWLGALTSDHGIMELPEWLQARGIGARRITKVEHAAFVALMTRHLDDTFGHKLTLLASGGGFGLDSAQLQELNLDPRVVRRAIADEAVKSHFVAAAYTLEQLLGTDPVTAPGEQAWLSSVQASTFPGRNPDVYLRLEPWVVVGIGKGTSHGSPYPYDQRLPLAFLGAPFPAGRDGSPASSMDVVPTLLRVLGIPQPKPMDGRDLLAPAGD